MSLTFRGKPLVSPPVNTRYIPVDVYNASGTAEKAVTDIQAVQGHADYATIAGAEGTYLTRLVSLPVKDASVGNMCDLYPTTFKTMTSVPDQLDLGERTSLEKFFSATPRDVHYTDDGFDDYIQDGDGGCRALLTAPMMDTSDITDMSQMFGHFFTYYLQTSKRPPLYKEFNYINACVNMVSVPQYNTFNVTNFAGMFAHCSSLTTVPQLDTSSGTNFSAMFYGCTSLPAVFPWAVNIGEVVDGDSLKSMFEGSSVEEVELFYTDPGATNQTFVQDYNVTLANLDPQGGLQRIRLRHYSDDPQDATVITS